MRIALLNPTYWPEVRRGSERVVHDLGAALAGRGHEVTVLTTHRGRSAVAEEDGIRVERAWRPPPLAPLRFYEHYVEAAPAALSRLARGRFDLAHAFFPTDAWAAAHARRLGGPPFVFSIHGIPTREYLVARRYRLEMLGRAIGAASTVTVLSEAAAEPLRRYALADPEVVPGGVDAAAFAVEVPRAPEPTLVCAASLADPRKRGELLIEAFARLRKRRPKVRLVLAGGADMPAYGADGLALPDGVERLGADDTTALAAAYAGAWASVLPSVEEAFGLVLVESLAAGTPVVAARSGAAAEIVAADGHGRLFEPDDAADLARAMEEALELGSDPQTGARCRGRAAEYDWSLLVGRWEAIYAAAITR